MSIKKELPEGTNLIGLLTFSPKWSWLTESEGPEVPAGKSHVVLFEGEAISEFVDTAVLQKKSPLCQLSSGNCSVYDLPDSPVLVVVSQEKNLNLFSLITQLLEPFISTAARVSTITVQSSVQHKRSDEDPTDDPVCYLRSLNGCTATVPGIKCLETPNIITGVAAGVSIWRQFKNLSPANNYVAYMEAAVYDSCSTAPLLALLRQLGVPCADGYTRRFKNESNLYL